MDRLFGTHYETSAGEGSGEDGGTGEGAGPGSGSEGQGRDERGRDDTFVAPRDQDEFDRMVAKRLRKEREKYGDYDDLKKKAEEYDKIEEQSKSDLQKAQDAQARAERERDDALANARLLILRANVVSEAARQNAVDPEAVFRLLDADSIEYDDSGEPKGIAEAVTGLLEDRPYLKMPEGKQRSGGGRRTGNGAADQGARGGDDDKSQLTQEDLADMSPEDIVKANREGRLANLTAPSK